MTSLMISPSLRALRQYRALILESEKMPVDLPTIARSDPSLEENFSALMHGNSTDGRLCVLEVCATRDSPLTNNVIQRLHDKSVADGWTSRDPDLSQASRQL